MSLCDIIIAWRAEAHSSPDTPQPNCAAIIGGSQRTLPSAPFAGQLSTPFTVAICDRDKLLITTTGMVLASLQHFGGNWEATASNWQVD